MKNEPPYSYQIERRPADVGGGYRLRLFEGSEEVGGGVFPLAEYAPAPADEAVLFAYEDALADAAAWLDSRPQPCTACHMLTFSGRDYLPTQMVPADVHIEDVAHALSLICRFGGHTKVHYSVAQHSLLVARILEEQGAPVEAQLAGLLHDAHEAYIGDIPTPIKSALGATWRDLEADVATAVRQALDVTIAFHDWEDLIKHVDRVALATERRDLMHFDANRNLPWGILGGVAPFHEKIGDPDWSPQWWADVFLDRYGTLRSAREATRLSHNHERKEQHA